MVEIRNIFNTPLEEIGMLRDGTDLDEIKKVVDLVCSAEFDRVAGFGAGRMGYALKAFMMRLCHIGFDAYMIGDSNFPKIDSKTLVFVNSSSGETPTSILYTQQAKNEGAFVVGVTQNSESSIGKLSDQIIQYPNIHSKQIMKTLPEQFTFILFDVLSEAVIEKLGRSRLQISNNHSISE